MAWTELHITTTAEHIDALSEQLFSWDASAVTLHDGGNQPIFEPSPTTPRVWDKTVLIGLFEETIDTNLIAAQLFKHAAVEDIAIKKVADEDWVRRCLDSFTPLTFGKRLWVCPSWQQPPSPDSVNVILDPGLAFGTGTHETTSLCLEWLDEHITSQKNVIDYGCGSGILGIAALKLGAKNVIAIDNDPQALVSAAQNAERNDLQPDVFKTFLPESAPKLQADLVIANILATPLITLSETLAGLTRPGGNIVLSGILNTQVEDICSTYSRWFVMHPPVFKGDWVRLTGIRANNI